MPRNPSGEYSLPASYLAVDGQTARADQHNEPLEDLRDALNEPTPIAKGGHGATTAAAGLAALGGMPRSESMPKAGGIFSGPVVHEQGATFQGPILATEIQEGFVSLSGVTPEIDLESGSVFALMTSGDTTLTISNSPASGRAIRFTLIVTATGDHALTFPASVRNAPEPPETGKTTVYEFVTYDGGVNWDQINARFVVKEDVQTFSTSGTWIKPSGAALVQVHLVAGGGGGANATSTTGGTGGSGGEGVIYTFLASDLGSSETVTIGAGGVGGANGVTNAAGSAGGNSSFGSHATAVGGNPGTIYNNIYASPANSVYPFINATSLPLEGLSLPHSGYGAASTRAAGNATYGGAGGGTGAQPAGTSLWGGDGGAGSDAVSTPASNGAAKGGGGGGSINDGGGGDGGDGYCRVMSWLGVVE